MAATLRQVWQVYQENGCEATVHRTVQTQLGADSDAPDVRAFLDALEQLLAESETLLRMLSIGLGGLFETQASFLGALLCEEALQPKIVDMLLEKLSEFSAEMDAQVMEKNVPKLILRELRWLDVVVDSRQLVEKLLGALPAFSSSLQRDVIYILPELAGDEDAAVVVDALLELIRVDAALVVCCIEALGNFNVLTEQTAAVTACVLERLDSSPLADLPAIVKYLVQEAPTSDMDTIVDELREKLSNTLAFSDTTSSDGNEEALILSSMVQSFYFREELLKVFIARIQSAGSGSGSTGSAPNTPADGPPLRLLDVWVLLGAYSIPKHEDKVGKLVRKKVHGGALPHELLVTSVCGHANALRALFPTLLQLAALLITHSSDAASVATGSLLYELLFEEFSTAATSDAGSASHQTAFYQGEVVSALLSHALSRTAATKDAALDTLRALVAPTTSFRDARRRSNKQKRRTDATVAIERHDRLRVFLPALKQLLDAMESCSIAHVRKIYDVLFAIGGAEDTDLCTTLRKQAFHQDARYRCFGIIAAVARTKRLLAFFREQRAAGDSSSNEAARKAEHDAVDSSQAAVDAETTKALSRAVAELHESCLAQPKCLAFVLRELELLMGSVECDAVGRALVDIVSEFYTDVLLNRFMADFDVQCKIDGAYSRLVFDGAMKTDLWVGLDDRLSPVYLKILDLVASPSLSTQQSLLFLGPLIGLLLTCARRKETLADIECVLVCPIQLMERSVLQDLSALDASVQNAVCLTLWHGVNWLRSILNFFACETSAYHAAKVAERLENLSLLESLLLDDALPASATFSPPGTNALSIAAATGSTESTAATTSAKSASDGKTTKKPGRPPGKKRLTSLDDRKLAVTQSFVPLKPDVVSILTSPRLQLGIAGDPLSQDAGATGLDMPLLEILFSLLERHVTQSCKRRAATTGFLSAKFAAAHAAAAATASGDILVHQYEPPSANELLETFDTSGVLDAAGKFAARILAAAERELQQLPSAATDSQTPDDPLESASRDARLLAHRRVLDAYLNVVAAAVMFNLGDASSNGSLAEPDARKMQQLQALLLPPDDRVEYVEGDVQTLQHTVKKFFKVLIRYHRVVGEDLDFAVALLKCLTTILSLAYGFDAELVLSKASSIDLNGEQQRRASLSSAIAAKISHLALAYLQKDWTRGDAKFVYRSAHIDVFLNAHLRHSAVVLDSIQALAIDGFVALLESNGARVATFPTLDRKTVGTYHRAMLSSLVAVTARLDIVGSSSSSSSSPASDVAFVFSYLTQAVLLFKLLVCMTKSFQQAVLVASVLKIGRRFLETILRVMPFLQSQFLVHSARVIKLISELQVATRRMQVLCAHGKLIKDPTASSQVPMVKKLLERLIYRSEELASANGVLDAYTTGVLKNRRIDGTTISKAELEAVSESESDASETECERDEGNDSEAADADVDAVRRNKRRAT